MLNAHPHFSSRLWFVAGLSWLLSIACTLGINPASPTIGSTSSPAPSIGVTAQPTSMPLPLTPTLRPPAQHRIGIRVINGVGEFYDRVTDQKFVPRGNNYIRLAQQTELSGRATFYHSTFNTDAYDATEADRALTVMQNEGYNVVRVWLNHCCSGGLTGTAGGLSARYLDNVVDFLRLAQLHDIYVMFTLDWLPGGKYDALISQDCCSIFALNNVHILSNGGLQANQTFFQDFIHGLIDRGAPLDVVWAYELRNEESFDSDQPPLSLTKGNVTTANGKTYDMALAADKQRMMDEGLVYWIDQVRQSILEVDPSALVSIGFFQPQSPHPTRIGDKRVIETKPAIWQSTADFIDLHAYPGGDLNLKQYVDNFKIDGMQLKPIIMGEFGAARSSFPSDRAAAQALHDWQVDSCQYGFDGWLLWTFDAAEQAEFFNGRGDGGFIDQVLAPINRPDPCQPKSFDFFERNIALGVQVKASRSLPDQLPTNAIDGTPLQWGAGDYAPQWIEMTLDAPSTIKSIQLTVAQYPDGETTHQIWVRVNGGSLELVHTFDGTTRDNDVLTYTPDIPLSQITGVRILTTKSLSWIGWKEIKILAP